MYTFLPLVMELDIYTFVDIVIQSKYDLSSLTKIFMICTNLATPQIMGIV